MMSFGKLFLSVFLLFSGLQVTAQAPTLNGDASSLGAGCYLITPDTSWQAGSVWFPDTINLNRAYHFVMTFNFGGTDAGADGIVFALQNIAPSVLGNAGEGMGYQNISNSLGIEFDTFENGPQSDPFFDHISIHRNGNVSHNNANHLAGPVAAGTGQINIEDSLDHQVEVRWDPVTTRLEVWFDCDLRLSVQNDLLNTTFFNDTTLFWGFTASSGGFFNAQSVCVQQILNTAASPDTLRICQGDTVAITAPPSFNQSHGWSPFYNLSDPSLQTVEVWPDTSLDYTVAFRDACGNQVTRDFYVEVLPRASVDLGPDDSLCIGSNLILNAGLGYTYQWSGGASSQTFTVVGPGVYSVTVSNGICEDSSSIEIFPQASPLIELGPTQDLCPGDSLQLGLNTSNGSTLLWSTGATTDSIWVSSGGSYSVIADSAGCNSYDTVLVNLIPAPPVDLGPVDSLVCDEDSLNLSAGLMGDSYLWSTGDTNATLTVFTSGPYTLQVSQNGCLGSDSIFVRFDRSPEYDLGPDIEHCGRDPQYLLSVGNPDGQVLWSTGEISAETEVTDFGFYWVDVQNQCGLVSDTVEVRIRSSAEEVFIPNVFSPNGDGNNDLYEVQAENLEDFFFRIFDRWGNVMDESNQQAVNWNGQDGDRPAPEGVYYYNGRVRDCRGELVTKSGTLTLVR